MKCPRRRVDRDAIPEQASREYLIGRSLESGAPPRETRNQRQGVGGGAHGASCTQSIAHNGSSFRCVKVKHNACIPLSGGRSAAGSTVTPSLPAAGASGSTAIGAPSQPSRRTSSSPADVLGGRNLIASMS